VTFEDLVRAFDAKGRGRKKRAKCPCHKSRGSTLIVSDDREKGLGVYCFAGCSNDDVLAAVGLSWKDLKPRKDWLPPEEFKALQIKRKDEEAVLAETKRKTRALVDETRRWEAVASLLHAHLVHARASPQEAAISRLWRKALATARDRHEKLCVLWPAAPQVEGYRIVRMPREITRRFTGDAIADVLGL